MRRFALFVNKYPLNSNDSWLSTDFAEFFAASGHKVYVFFNDWNGGIKKISRKNKVIIFSYPAYAANYPFHGFQRWFLSGFYSLLVFMRLRSRIRVDFIQLFSPVFIFWPVVFFSWFQSISMRLIYWDFFPEHQIQMGLIRRSSLLAFLFAFIERLCVGVASKIYLMSECNIKYFKIYFNFKDNSKLFELPLWAKDSFDVSTALDFKKIHEIIPGFNKNSFNIVWGGQLVHGRGIGVIQKIAKFAASMNYDLNIYVFGAGQNIDALAEGCDNIHLMGKLARSSYVSILPFFSAALISLDFSVQLPAYPSKILDYSCHSLPLLCFVNSHTDFGYYVENFNAGVVLDGDTDAIIEGALMKMFDDEQLRSYKSGSRNLFLNRHEISRILDSYMEV
jgi:hypothetical protein